MKSIADCASPDHVLHVLVTHSDQFSCSKLAVSNQFGTIPVRPGKTKPFQVDDDDGDTCTVHGIVLLILPESECICAKYDKKEQSYDKGC